MTEKQKLALRVLNVNKTTLLYGGSRSGKTFLTCLYLHSRAIKHPNSWHLLARRTYTDAKKSLWEKTLTDILRLTNVLQYVVVNQSATTVEYPNGSKLIVDGLGNSDTDTKRLDKILGLEYASIFLNEASQISYESYGILTTRLNPPQGVSSKVIIDYNPPSKMHWGYRVFEDREFPKDSNDIEIRSVPKNDYAVVRMNPSDNIENLSPDYLSQLETLSYNQRVRFLEGNYGEIDGALWKSEWIKVDNDVKAGDMTSITIGVDPAGTVHGDAVGIVVCGTDLEKYYILEDATEKGRTVYQWASKVSELYEKYFDVCAEITVVAEKNYGGDMVEATLLNENPNMIIKMVNATRGKALRAEPIASLYEKNLVIHTDQFLSLVNELLSWTPTSKDFSPNRMDALVWGVTNLQNQYGNVIAYSNSK